MANAQDLMQNDFILADIDDTVASLIGQMERRQQHEAVVLDGTTYLGMVSRRWLLSSRIDPVRMRLRNIISKRSKSKAPFFVPKLAPETGLREVARLLATADVHALPVIVRESGKEKVIGVVRVMNMLPALRDAYKRVRADELATMQLTTITEDEEVGKALNLMNRQGIGHVVVVNGQDKLVGILGLSDILTHIHALPRSTVRLPKAASHQRGKHTGFGTGEKDSILALPVHNIITHVPNCCTISPTASVSAAIDAMVERGVVTAVLTTNDTPVGILAAKDILEDYAKK